MNKKDFKDLLTSISQARKIHRRRLKNKMSKKILAQANGYKVECDGIYHYFTGKDVKNFEIGKCRCKNE